MEVVSPSGEKFEFFIPLRIQIEKDFNYIDTGIKPYFYRALKPYLNDENLGGFLDRQIGMEPLVIDWAKEEAKMARILRNIHVYC